MFTYSIGQKCLAFDSALFLATLSMSSFRSLDGVRWTAAPVAKWFTQLDRIFSCNFASDPFYYAHVVHTHLARKPRAETGPESEKHNKSVSRVILSLSINGDWWDCEELSTSSRVITATHSDGQCWYECRWGMKTHSTGHFSSKLCELTGSSLEGKSSSLIGTRFPPLRQYFMVSSYSIPEAHSFAFSNHFDNKRWHSKRYHRWWHGEECRIRNNQEIVNLNLRQLLSRIYGNCHSRFHPFLSEHAEKADENIYLRSINLYWKHHNHLFAFRARSSERWAPSNSCAIVENQLWKPFNDAWKLRFTHPCGLRHRQHKKSSLSSERGNHEKAIKAPL